MRTPIAAVGLALLSSGTTRAAGQEPLTSTVVIYYAVPEKLADRKVNATCVSPSHAAWFRRDAFSCVVGSDRIDPCFATPLSIKSLAVASVRTVWQ